IALASDTLQDRFGKICLRVAASLRPGSLEACPGWRSASRRVFGLDSMTLREQPGGPEGEVDSPTAAVITVRAQPRANMADMPDAMITTPPSERFLAVDGRLEN
ncbi:hypothetical protein, partial [Mycobacterium avium]|uniref:hypothetical protein n=1 Tax=Mycobacterium avium TaxID=1764 RepID=UPI001F2DAA4D